MKGMVGEKGLLPERSEWFRSRGIIGTRGEIGLQGTVSETHQLFKNETMICEMNY
jgi:hypothetical protein